MNTPSADFAGGRAKVVRPPVYLFFLALLLALVAAPAANAAPSPPALTATSPESPGASLTPRIQGRADGIIISGVPMGRSIRPVTMGANPGDTITIYADDSTCKNASALAAEGTVEELEGTGIEVTVGPNSVTTFYATLGDETGTSTCSVEGLTYRQVTGAPSTPSFSAVVPASPANDNFPHLVGSADPESTVLVYTDPGCEGVPTATGTGAVFVSAGIQVAVPDNSTTTFFAKATWGGFPSPCSGTSISYQEVTPPPATPPPGTGVGGSQPASGSPQPPHLRTVPGGVANDDTPLVTGSAPGAASVEIFTNSDCAGSPVAKGSAAQFATGLQVRVLANAAVAFYGVSVGPGGSRSGCSTPVLYVEDSLAPHTRITMGPASKTRKRTAVFRFMDTTGDAPGTNFFCKLDRRRWKRCSSPLDLRGLRVKRYLLRVRAIDPAGNVESRAAKRRFKVVPRS